MASITLTHVSTNYSPGRLGVNESYADIISTAENAPVSGNTNVNVVLRASTTSNQFQDNSYGLFRANLSPLPANAVVDTASFQWVTTSRVNGLGDPAVRAYYSPGHRSTAIGNDYLAWDDGTEILIGEKAWSAVTGTIDYALTGSALTALQDSIDNDESQFPITIIMDWQADASFGGTWASGAATTVGGNRPAPDAYDLDLTYHIRHTTSISGSVATSANVTANKKAYTSISGTIETDGSVRTGLFELQTIFKTYLYKVYDSNGDIVGVWDDIDGDPRFTQRINEAGSELFVTLARSAERLQSTNELLHTESAEVITTEADIDLLIGTNDVVTVGTGTDLDLGYTVDLYVYYGSNEELFTESGEQIITETSEDIFVGTGAPNGRRIFTGTVVDYRATYGARDVVTTKLLSKGWDMSNRVYESGGNTTITENSQDPSDIMKNILDTYSGEVGYNASSVDDTGTTVSYSFNLGTVLDAVEKTLELCPPDWYWFVDLGTSTLHLKEKSSTADHIFTLGREIQNISLSKSMEDMVNTVFFVGGDNGGSRLYKKYSDSSAITEWGKFERPIVDLSVTTDAGAQIQSENFAIDRLKDPRFTSEITVNSGAYDIETIMIGDSIGFRNFNNFVDDLVLQVVALRYTPEVVTLTLDYELPQQRNRIEDIKRNQEKSDIDGIGVAPS